MVAPHQMQSIPNRLRTREMILLGLLLLVACRNVETTRPCEAVSAEALSAIKAAGPCADAITSKDGDASIAIVDDCLQRHRVALALTSEAERVCTARQEVLTQIRETRDNLAGIVHSLELNRRVLKGEVQPEDALIEMLDKGKER